jgi:hypothetical protein
VPGFGNSDAPAEAPGTSPEKHAAIPDSAEAPPLAAESSDSEIAVSDTAAGRRVARTRMPAQISQVPAIARLFEIVFYISHMNQVCYCVIRDIFTEEISSTFVMSRDYVNSSLYFFKATFLKEDGKCFDDGPYAFTQILNTEDTTDAARDASLRFQTIMASTNQHLGKLHRTCSGLSYCLILWQLCYLRSSGSSLPLDAATAYQRLEIVFYSRRQVAALRYHVPSTKCDVWKTGEKFSTRRIL